MFNLGRYMRLLAMLLISSLAVTHTSRAQQNGRITPENVGQLVELASLTVKAQGVQGISGVTISPDNTRLGIAMRDGTARLWTLNPPQEQAVLTGHKSTVNAVAFANDGLTLASASNDRTIRLWDAIKGVEAYLMGPAKAPVTSLTFSPNGEWLASGSIDNLVTLWRANGDREKIFTGHQGAVLSVAFSPDSRVLASASVDKTVRLWDVNNKSQIGVLKGAQNQLLAVTFSPDRTLIAAGERAFPKSTVYLWDATSGEPVGKLAGIVGQLASLAFSPDGSLLAIGAGNGTVELWDVLHQTRAASFAEPNARSDQLVNSLTFSADGTLLVWTGSTVHIWGLPAQ